MGRNPHLGHEIVAGVSVMEMDQRLPMIRAQKRQRHDGNVIWPSICPLTRSDHHQIGYPVRDLVAQPDKSLNPIMRYYAQDRWIQANYDHT